MTTTDRRFDAQHDAAQRRRLRAIVCAWEDMDTAASGAEWWLEVNRSSAVPMPARRALETGVIVAYARPFVDARANTLPKMNPAPGLPSELVAAHDEALVRRHRADAHTDDQSGFRGVVGSETKSLAELAAATEVAHSWGPPGVQLMQQIIELARRNQEHFQQLYREWCAHNAAPLAGGVSEAPSTRESSAD
jgi:hypothetical protein